MMYNMDFTKLVQKVNYISPLKLAGVKDFITIDFYNQKVILRYFHYSGNIFNIFSTDLIQKIHFIDDKKETNIDSLKNVNSILKRFIAVNNIHNALIVINVSEFKSTVIEIPTENDDSELWLLENSSKFLPDGQAKDDFIYTNEVMKSEDKKLYSLITVVRKDSISDFSSFEKLDECLVYTSIPFINAIINLNNQNKTIVAIDIQDEQIFLSYKTPENDFLTESVFADIIVNNNQNYESIYELEKLVEEIISLLPSNELKLESENDLLLYLNGSDDVTTHIVPLLKTGIEKSNNWNNMEIIAREEIISQLVINILLSQTTPKNNLLPIDKIEQINDRIDKKTGLRIVLFLGAFLIILLLGAFIGEGYIGKSVFELDEINSELRLTKTQLDDMVLDNEKLLRNIKSLTNLKMNNLKASHILHTLSNNIPQTVNLNFLSIVEKDSTSYEIILNGSAYNHQNIIDFLGFFESHSSYHAPLLNIAELNKKSAEKSDPTISFKITTKYDDDKK